MTWDIKGSAKSPMNPPIKYPNPSASLTDYILGRWQWYRQWRGGYWFLSNLSDSIWWRHKPLRDEERWEDYRPTDHVGEG